MDLRSEPNPLKTYYLSHKRITLAMAALSYGAPEPFHKCR